MHQLCKTSWEFLMYVFKYKFVGYENMFEIKLFNPSCICIHSFLFYTKSLKLKSSIAKFKMNSAHEF